MPSLNEALVEDGAVGWFAPRFVFKIHEWRPGVNALEQWQHGLVRARMFGLGLAI